jgi:serine protease Do
MRKVIVAAVTAILLTGTAMSGVGPRGAGSGVAFAQDVLTLRGFGSQIGVTIRETADAVVVDAVRDGTPADRAGVRSGDVIVEFDGERIRSARQFTRIVQETRPDRAVTMVVTRNGSRQSLNVTPENAGRDFARMPELRLPPDLDLNIDIPELPQVYFGNSMRGLGAQLSPLSDQLAEYFGVPGGALVTSVEANSVAAKAGLKAGDVITSVNGRAIKAPSEAARELRDVEAKSNVELRVMRDKKSVTMKMTMPERERTRARAGSRRIGDEWRPRLRLRSPLAF